MSESLTWGDSGQKFFQLGVDKGVLYVGDQAVPWNGLVKVVEKDAGAETRTLFIDGIKMVNAVIQDDFAATIEAFTYPDEFSACLGTQPYSAGSGLMLPSQVRSEFGLCYRTKLGNDVAGVDYDYKLHLIYNATAMPDEREFSTISEESAPMTFSWDISTRPEIVPGFKPLAHVTLDMRRIPSASRIEIERILYGYESTAPRMLAPQELLSIFEGMFVLTITDHGDGTWTASSTDEVVTVLTETSFGLNYPTVDILDANTYKVSSG